MLFSHILFPRYTSFCEGLSFWVIWETAELGNIPGEGLPPLIPPLSLILKEGDACEVVRPGVRVSLSCLFLRIAMENALDGTGDSPSSARRREPSLLDTFAHNGLASTGEKEAEDE